MRGKFLFLNKVIFSLLLFLVFGIFFSATTFASDLTSTHFIVRDPVIGSGGGYAASGTFKLFSSQDSVFTGHNSSLDFIGEYGFLYFPSGVTPTPTPTPTPSSGGGGGIRVIGPNCGTIADFNCDGYVDLLDLSIFLFYYKHSGMPATTYDLNSDGVLNLKDISIIFYYWSPPHK
jgi:hypothetical protein